jgi:hypothetical protein
MRFLKRLFLVFFIILTVFLVSGVVISLIYSDEVKQKIVTEINKNLKTEISVGEVNFSVIRKFPNASLEFRDVLIKSVNSFDKGDFQGHFPDTLLSAKRLFLEFDINSLITKKYIVRSIHIEEGLVNVMVDKQGNENFRFWEEKAGRQETDFKIDLQDLRIFNMELFFSNITRQLSVKSHINRILLNGNFSAYQYRLKSSADMNVKDFKHEDFTISGFFPVSAMAELDVNGDLFKISQGQLNIGKMRFLTEGEYYGGGINRIDISVVGDGLDLNNASSFLSGKYLDFFNNYNPYGSVIFSARMHGRFSRNERPSVAGDFALQDAGLSRRGIRTKIQGLWVKGSFSNGRLASPLSYSFELESFAGFVGNSPFRGNMKIENLVTPYLKGNILFDGSIGELADFYKPSDVESAAGKMKVGLTVNGYLEKLRELSLENIPQVFPEIKLEITDGSLFLNEKPWQFESINGKMHLTRKLVFDSLSFMNRGNHFVLSGELFSDAGYVFRKGANLNMKGSVHSGHLNLDVLLPDTGTRAADQKVLLFPEKIFTDVSFSCDEFYFREFKARNIKGIVNYKPRMFTLNSITFSSMDGTVTGGGAIIQKMNNDFLFQAQTSFESINISDLFFSFNNFSQTFITNKHLKGSLSGTLNFISEWNNDFDLMADKIVADSKIQITGGELVNFEPMTSLSRFIEVEELKHVRFSKLQNEIFIRNQIVTIPTMEIQSSAFNITVSGTHGFNNQFNYRLRVLLSDVLFAKAKRAKKENEQYAIMEDEGVGRTILPLILSGTPDDFKVTYDRRAAADIIRQGFEEEKKTLRKILNEEFGWFSKDTSGAKPIDTQQRSPIYKIEWDEDVKKEVVSPRQEIKKDTVKKQFQITWDEDEKQDTTKRKKSS